MGKGAGNDARVEFLIRNTGVFSNRPPWEERDKYEIPETPEDYARHSAMGFSDVTPITEAARQAAEALANP